MKVTELKVGKHIRITNPGRSYTTYNKMAENLGAARYAYGLTPDKGTRAFIQAWDVHDDKEDIVVLVESPRNMLQYLIGVEGLTEIPRNNNKSEKPKKKAKSKVMYSTSCIVRKEHGPRPSDDLLGICDKKDAASKN